MHKRWRKCRGGHASPVEHKLNSRSVPAKALGTRLDDGLWLYYVDNTLSRRTDMDFLKTMQPKDWVIAAMAFFAGAIIF